MIAGAATAMVDVLDESARTWGAVNTIRFEAQAGDGDAEVGHVGEVRQPHPARLVGLTEDDVLIGSVHGAPSPDAPLQGPPDPFAEIGMTAQDLLEDGNRPQTGRGFEERHDLGRPNDWGYPVRALRTLLGLGVAFVLVTFVVGDYLSPISDRYAQLLKARYLGQITVGQTGAWLRERKSERHYAVNVARLSSDGRPEGIRIFEFDAQGQWLSLMQADSADLQEEGIWTLENVARDGLLRGAQAPSGLQRQHLAELDWPTGITTEMTFTPAALMARISLSAASLP